MTENKIQLKDEGMEGSRRIMQKITTHLRELFAADPSARRDGRGRIGHLFRTMQSTANAGDEKAARRPRRGFRPQKA